MKTIKQLRKIIKEKKQNHEIKCDLEFKIDRRSNLGLVDKGLQYSFNNKKPRPSLKKIRKLLNKFNNSYLFYGVETTVYGLCGSIRIEGYGTYYPDLVENYSSGFIDIQFEEILHQKKEQILSTCPSCHIDSFCIDGKCSVCLSDRS